jgi:hypothetical protein
MARLAFPLATMIVGAAALRLPVAHRPAVQARAYPISLQFRFQGDNEANVENLKRRVRGMLDDVPPLLVEGAEMPSSTARLEAAYEANDRDAMYFTFLEFYMDMKLDFDMDENDRCCPTVHQCRDPDDDMTRHKLPVLYETAMSMTDGESPIVKMKIFTLVVDKLSSRVGLDNLAFASWAGNCLQDLNRAAVQKSIDLLAR